MRLETFLKHLRPRYLWAHRRGRCTVCGHATLFLLTGDVATIRNHAVCVRCGSCSRNRHLALCALDAIRDRGASSLAALGRDPAVAIYHTAASGAVSKALGQGANVVRSEFLPGVPAGETRDGVLCQDLEKLAFPDSRFDLVLSEDVFEHLGDYRAGFREVHRVLKPGGYHVLSVPFYFDRRTRDLWDPVDGRRVLREPIEFHGDPIRGQIPCFTHFGYDLLDWLGELGFSVRIEMSRTEEILRHGTFDCYTLVTRKE